MVGVSKLLDWHSCRGLWVMGSSCDLWWKVWAWCGTDVLVCVTFLPPKRKHLFTNCGHHVAWKWPTETTGRILFPSSLFIIMSQSNVCVTDVLITKVWSPLNGSSIETCWNRVSEHPYISGFFQLSMLSVGAKSQLWFRSDGELWWCHGYGAWQAPKFMTNVVIVFIICPLLDQDLGLPEMDWVNKEPKKPFLHQNKDGGCFSSFCIFTQARFSSLDFLVIYAGLHCMMDFFICVVNHSKFGLYFWDIFRKFLCSAVQYLIH